MSISDFSSNFGSGIRATHFTVVPDWPFGCAENQPHLYIKAAQMPTSTIGTIEIPYRGRKIKRPGDRTFDTWNLTVTSDSDGHLRQCFVAWMNSLDTHSGGAGTYTDYSQVAKTWIMQPQTPAGVAIEGAEIALVNTFPTEVGAMEFSYDSTDQLAEFTVTMQFDYWTGGGAPA